MNNRKIAVYSFCILLFIFSVMVRIPKQNTNNFYNSDATYHALLTMQAYDETPFSVHKFLPIVSLGDENDKFIPWGATVPDKLGNYYYTSFAPLGFMIPYFFVKLFNLPINEMSLYAFNSIILLFSLLLTNYLFLRVFKNKISDHFILLATTTIYLFQTEIMHSQGIVYWPHSLYQLLFLAQVSLFLNIRSRKSRLLFLGLCFIGPLIEWTGYVSNFGFCIGILISKDFNRELNAFKSKVYFIFKTALLTAVSLLIFCFHFLLNLTGNNFYNAMKMRFLSRSFLSKETLLDLLREYFSSYGLLLVLIIALLMLTLLFSNPRTRFIGSIRENYIVWVIVTFPLLENLIMKQHAILYSFDRIKGVFVLIIMFLTITFAWKESISNKKIGGILIILVLIGISLFNVYNYSFKENEYRWRADYLDSNKNFASELNKIYTEDNSVFGQFQLVTRGYSNLLFSKGIYEAISESDLVSISKDRGKQYAVLLLPEARPWNMNVYSRCVVIDNQTNERSVISLINNNLSIEKQN